MQNVTMKYKQQTFTKWQACEKWIILLQSKAYRIQYIYAYRPTAAQTSRGSKVCKKKNEIVDITLKHVSSAPLIAKSTYTSLYIYAWQTAASSALFKWRDRYWTSSHEEIIVTVRLLLIAYYRRIHYAVVI